MKPDLPVVFEALADVLQGELSAQLMESYAGLQVLRMSSFLPSFGIEYDRAASRRVEENAALRVLFAHAAPQVGDATLKHDLLQASDTKDDDLRVSALQHGNDRLRALLVRLHAWAEDQEASRVQPLLDGIRQELKRSTERRALPIDRM